MNEQPANLSLTEVGEGFRYLAWGVAALFILWLATSATKARR